MSCLSTFLRDVLYFICLMCQLANNKCTSARVRLRNPRFDRLCTNRFTMCTFVTVSFSFSICSPVQTFNYYILHYWILFLFSSGGRYFEVIFRYDYCCSIDCSIVIRWMCYISIIMRPHVFRVHSHTHHLFYTHR